MPHILLIDDSAFARKNIKHILGEQYTYIEAADGMSGLEAYFLYHPDLVILDITMPGVGGLEILEQLRQLDNRAQVVICSADIQDYNRIKSLELGARAFIGKPVVPEALLAIVQQIVDEAGG